MGGSERLTQGTSPTDYGYTGQKREGGDIYYYNARWYDPMIGRFMQADTIVPLQVQGTQPLTVMRTSITILSMVLIQPDIVLWIHEILTLIMNAIA